MNKHVFYIDILKKEINENKKEKLINFLESVDLLNCELEINQSIIENLSYSGVEITIKIPRKVLMS